MTREDINFMNIADSSAMLKDGHYSLDLHFRCENPILLNRCCIAEQRLMSLTRTFVRIKGFQEEYTSFLNVVNNQGYAEIVPAESE